MNVITKLIHRFQMSLLTLISNGISCYSFSHFIHFKTGRYVFSMFIEICLSVRIEQDAQFDVNCCSDNQDISSNFWNRKVPYRFLTSQPLVWRTASNPRPPIPIYKIRFNIILLSLPVSSKLSLPFRDSCKNSSLQACYTPLQTRSPWV
jgi:hypothetical protein